jgi:hypothetical protein
VIKCGTTLQITHEVDGWMGTCGGLDRLIGGDVQNKKKKKWR